MTDVQQDSTVSTSDTSAKPEKARKPRQARSSYSVTDLARARLRKRGIKTDDKIGDECKTVRGDLRRNWSNVIKADPSIKKAKQAPNDRKPWPTNMNAKVADMIVNGNKPNAK